MLKKGIIPTILFIMVMIGCIIVNIKNTEALSPFGNTIDNYQIVTKEHPAPASAVLNKHFRHPA